MATLSFITNIPRSSEQPVQPIAVMVQVYDGESDEEAPVSNMQAAIDVLHYVFPFAPVPMRIEPGFYSGEYLVDVDATTYQRVGNGDWMQIEVKPAGHPVYQVEIPQPI